jgi:hypothetical protein
VRAYARVLQVPDDDWHVVQLRKERSLSLIRFREQDFPPDFEFQRRDLTALTLIDYGYPEVGKLVDFGCGSVDDLLAQPLEGRIHSFRYSHQLSEFLKGNEGCFSVFTIGAEIIDA